MTKIIFNPAGTMHAIYNEGLCGLGKIVYIKRASSVEVRGSLGWREWCKWWRLRSIPTGMWYADLAPVRGPVLGPFPQRSDALQAEVAWLDANWQPT